jgi:predicted N-acetyltransferase YhbS
VLDEWLREHALGAQAGRTGRTFVWHNHGVVVAYYTLAAHRIARDILPAKLGRGSPDQIPAILLARLALDVSLHGRSLGGRLLGEACYRAAVASRTVGARMIVVDALDDSAATFYERHGFRRLASSLRLAHTMSDATKVLGDL